MRRAILLLALGALLAIVSGAGLGACAAPRRHLPAPVSAAASAALAEARAALRAPGDRGVARAREALDEARSLAPDWVAPRRAIDDLLRADLLALEALSAYREALARDGEDAATLYLLGRLEGRAGSDRFARAARLDPSLAWAWHGLAVQRGEDGPPPRFAAERALSLARDPFERTYFSANLARIDAAAGRLEDAVRRLDARVEDPETAPADRIELAVQAALLELGAPRFRVVESGIERALEVVRGSDTTDAETVELVSALKSSIPGADPGRIALALAARPGAVRDRLRAEILLDEAPTPLALGLLERGARGDGPAVPRGSLLRAARFSAGDFGGAVERWLAELPAVVRDADGLPRDARLARVVHASRAAQEDASVAALQAFCAALLDAGWFREARAVAARLATGDLDGAVEHDARALAATTFLSAVRGLFAAMDASERRGARVALERDAEGVPVRPKPRTPRSLDELLAALAPHAAVVRAFAGGAADSGVDAVRADLVGSPRRTYGGVATVVHPGPTYSRLDQRARRGTAGEPVGGLAALLHALGRFGIFGALGGEPADGTVLPVLFVEERSGEHLGVPWHGTIAWCEGADVASRASRRGVRIAGAALHEGYWIDVDVVRGEHAAWEALARRFDDSPERVRRALEVGGLAVGEGADARGARVATEAILGGTQRVRLAVMADRARDGAPLGRVELDEFVAVTAAHEEGHLCDRTRFLPLSRRWPWALALLANQGFSASAVHEELELRAQLTALCVVDDPRIPLAQILDAAEGGSSVTPHAAAYARLLANFLAILDERVQAGALPRLAAGRSLVHQLHRLAPDEVRAIALELAREKRMIGR